ncbi:hypothetical protein KC967_01935 [Candidatus Saccharibacteria bacterium]|nr:hypothetical protein [Candidatus Saccharibacteria bacterium]
MPLPALRRSQKNPYYDKYTALVQAQADAADPAVCRENVLADGGSHEVHVGGATAESVASGVENDDA